MPLVAADELDAAVVDVLLDPPVPGGLGRRRAREAEKNRGEEARLGRTASDRFAHDRHDITIRQGGGVTRPPGAAAFSGLRGACPRRRRGAKGHTPLGRAPWKAENHGSTLARLAHLDVLPLARSAPLRSSLRPRASRRATPHRLPSRRRRRRAASLAKIYAVALAAEAQDSTAAEPFLDLLDLAIANADAPGALAAGSAAIDALVTGTTAGLDGMGPTAIAYPIARS